MSSYDHAKTSKYDLSKWMRLSFSLVDKGDPIFNSLGWLAVLKSTISTYPTIGVAFSSESCCAISSYISSIYEVGE